MARNRKIIYLAGFLSSIPIALTSYINSSFLENYINKYSVSIVYIIASIATIVLMFMMPNILTFLGNRKTTLLFCILTFLSFLTMGLSNNGPLIIFSFILCFISTNFIFASLDIFIEDFSKNSAIGGLRGLYLMTINSAWIIAQIISGSIIAKSSFQGIYILSALFMIFASFIFVITLRNFKDPLYSKVPLLKTINTFIKNRNISRIYFINLILKFFFAWMIIYTPIYLHEYIGFGWDKIGVIFTIMLLPFFFFDFILGEISDKIGERKILLLGFAISGIFTLIIPFITEPTIWLWAFVLFMTRVGAAGIEVMSESYFFKSVKEEDADILGFFRNTTPLSYIIAPLCAIPILLLVPSFEYLFFVLGGVMFYGLYVTIRLKDVR